MRAFLAVTKALSDANRVRALMALGAGELCVCQLIELLELAPSTVSRHMAVLHQAHLVEMRKAGRWIYYRSAGDDAPPAARQGAAMAAACLKGDPRIGDDAARLKRIRGTNPRDLCTCYHG